jgi:hypothetical protein
MQLLDEGKKLVVRAGLGGRQMESLLMNIEANAYQATTEYSNARPMQEAILHQTSVVLSPVGHGCAVVNIALLDTVTGASADVVSRNLDAAATAFRNGHNPRGICWCELFHADLRLQEGDATGAKSQYLRLFAATCDSNDGAACHCLEQLADPTKPVHANTLESARWAVVFFAFALRPLVRNPLTVHQAFRRLGDALVGQGAENSALNILAIALDGFTQMDVHQGRAECMRTIGDVHVQHGDLSKAREMWESARPLFECSEQKKEVARIDERLQTLEVAQKFHALTKAELPAPQILFQESDTEGEEKEPHLVPDL